MSSLHGVVSSVNTLCDEVAYLILTLSEHTTSAGVLQMIGRTVFIACTSCLVLFCSSARSLGVPCIPVCRVVHLICKHITRIVAHVVGRAIYEVEVHHLLLLYVINFWMISFCCFVFRRKHHCTCRDDSSILAAVLAVSDGDVGLINKQVLL